MKPASAALSVFDVRSAAEGRVELIHQQCSNDGVKHDAHRFHRLALARPIQVQSTLEWDARQDVKEWRNSGSRGIEVDFVGIKEMLKKK